ncbi:diacylglycerol kinase family protein [Nocardioides marmoribigeumensis]|uniref:YegS/Rv2252/BmrU family lipid kinase n=1 Tax=Nocardioides marmoribigeumensis TaxID=433649 RepID=A0ABU2BWU7_9ACTN|nr:diacylglycerol kinase family protein [Nocardioides marmoribigeumensis]MDR7362209.1 YegS/Rv2252/BmrU family lipid kinase [Nocardioides marmoribigeumensis]
MTFSAETRRRLLAGALVSLLVLLAACLLVGLAPHTADRVDVWFGQPLAGFTDRHPGVERAAEVLAELFRVPPVALYTLAIAGLLLVKRHVRPAAWVVAVTLATTLLTTLLKQSFARPRPSYAHMQLLDGAFPSGHSSGTACLAGILMVLATMFLRRRSQRRLVAVGGVLLALLLGLDRLLLGVHGLTDVVAGFALAALVVCAATYLADPTPRAKPVDPLPSVTPSNGRLAVILNPIKVESPEAFRALLDTRAAELGWHDPLWFETTIEDPGRSMAAAAAEAGAELVVVCGGDGTVRTVCAELAGTGIPVGVVPAGTGNLLARNLDLPLYLNNAVEVALNGQDRAIDLVRISGDGIGEDEHFLVMAGMGFDAAIMEGANEQIKAKIGWLAYVVSGLRNLMFPAAAVEISVDDGEPTKHRARTIVVGNVGFLQAGLPLLPDATIDDGRLDVVLVNPARFLHWLLVVVRVVTRGKKLDETVNRMTGRKVVIRASAEIPRQIDGDFIGLGHEITCECLHGKLLVRVPR